MIRDVMPVIISCTQPIRARYMMKILYNDFFNDSKNKCEKLPGKLLMLAIYINCFKKVNISC